MYPPRIWMYLNEQIPMVCLGCLENKYFPRDLINPVGWFSTKPSGTSSSSYMSKVAKNPEKYVTTFPFASVKTASIHKFVFQRFSKVSCGGRWSSFEDKNFQSKGFLQLFVRSPLIVTNCLQVKTSH